MHQFIQFLSVINIGSNLSTSTCPSSSYTNVVKCYGDYFNYFNLTIGPNLEFPDYQTFVINRAQLEATTEVTDFLNYCNIQNRLAGCLSRDVSCINPDDLSKIGKFNNYDNLRYAGDYNMTSYECTTGYHYIINNYNCLINANFLFKDEISNCVNNYIKNIPSEGECPATNDYIKCFDDIYSSYCGVKAGNLFCNILTNGFSIEIPACNGKLMTCLPL